MQNHLIIKGWDFDDRHGLPPDRDSNGQNQETATSFTPHYPRFRQGSIEAWFEALTCESRGKKTLSWASIAKLKSIMSQVFKHAQRHELIPAAIGADGRPTNPVVLARSESGSDYEAVVVEPEQMIIILNELDTPETRLEWTLALLHAATALRPEEAFGLKWGDVDWGNGQIHIRRGWSKGKETLGKN